MKLPTMQWHPSLTTVLALYGAVISTITALIQLSNHLRDRPSIRVHVRRNMKTNDPMYAGMILTIVTATNIGRRPVTISGFVAALLFEKGVGQTQWFLTDVHPRTPCEITEGKTVAAYVNEKGMDFKKVSYWYVWDSAGREYRLNFAPWYQRWWSKMRYRLATTSHKQVQE